jgi:hypothetical protein
MLKRLAHALVKNPMVYDAVQIMAGVTFLDQWLARTIPVSSRRFIATFGTAVLSRPMRSTCHYEMSAPISSFVCSFYITSQMISSTDSTKRLIACSDRVGDSSSSIRS